MELNEEAKEWVDAAAKSSGEKIEQSSVFMGLFTTNYKKDPLAALQLGIAIMLDKPIAIIALEGVSIPEHVKKIAFIIELVPDPNDKVAFARASTNVMEKAAELGLWS